MSSLLTVNNLSLKIDRKTLLSEISFTLLKGDYLCILGANGAGKSSLLKILMGITNATTGIIELNQQRLSDLSQKQRAHHLSYVPQAQGHDYSVRVEEFIKMGRYAHYSVFSDWQEADRLAVDRAIAITDTECFLHRQMNTLSGGEAQRVFIAAAICQQSAILLLDEPTSFLDPYHQIEMHRLIHTLNKLHGISIIEVCHDLNHATQHSQHILALKHGKTLWYGESSAFMQSQQLHSLYDHQFVLSTHPQSGAVIALPCEL